MSKAGRESAMKNVSGDESMLQRDRWERAYDEGATETLNWAIEKLESAEARLKSVYDFWMEGNAKTWATWLKAEWEKEKFK